MDSSLLDVSAEIIGETPKKKPMSPKSFAKDVVERLAIVTPSGRVDAAEFLSSNILENTKGYGYTYTVLINPCIKPQNYMYQHPKIISFVTPYMREL